MGFLSNTTQKKDVLKFLETSSETNLAKIFVQSQIKDEKHREWVDNQLAIINFTLHQQKALQSM